MEMDLTFLENGGISIEEGIAYTGNREKYAAALQRYFRGHEDKRKDLKESLESGDLQEFMIRVHALKSNSRMIGASEMGAAFEALELAAKREDRDFINGNFVAALKQYDELIELLRPVGEMAESTAAGRLSAAEAKETIDKLLEALDDFDDELAKGLLGKLKGYPFGEAEKEKLHEASERIADFLYDEAAALVGEIKEKLPV
ncbi:MAG: Hpt domain-containing protein [Lachnospiraceae bacterium]|nr:Hpt domain-containing protein [Lachnospiraceae bacterium]